MRDFFKSLLVAFSMYSRIPTPTLAWNKRNMQFALFFLPAVGVVAAGAEACVFLIFGHFAMRAAFFAAAALLVPLALTGGIHFDGYCDTCDALSSHAGLEKKLEIMKDPHVGAFGPMYTAAVMLVQFGAWQQIYETPGLLLSALAAFVLSRAFVALAILCFKKAKHSGLAATFSDFSAKGPCVAALVSLIVLVTVLLCAFGGVKALIVPGGIAVLFPLFHRFCKKQFAGVTGDLAGYFVTVSETVSLVLAAFFGAVFAAL